MKNIILIAALLLPGLLNAQITIDKNDMPVPGDTFRIHTAVEFLGDPSLTGANYVWDFSTLASLSERVDSFLDPGDTPLVYQLIFNSIFNPEKASVAIEMFEAPSFVPGIEITDALEFFRNSNDYYARVGIGVTLSGIQMPIQYSSPEEIYQFPLDYLDSFTDNSSFEISVPTFGFFSEEISRETTVDGWGTLKLPMGDFNVLRVKSLVTRSDSVYIDATSMGFALPPITTTEYHWLGKETGLPLLQINSTLLAASTVFYQDTTTSSTIAIIEKEKKPINARLFPNPTSGLVNLEYSIETNSKVKIDLLDEKGSLLAQLENREQLPGQYNLQISGDEHGLSKGIYYISLEIDAKLKVLPFFFIN
ncbi:MAG: T9SS type A sorting domain-containing protein [Bacteroidales bacterium]|nr:T9SS type A sorting domain-containing protein [Bacteroidales bacterium]MCF8455065.1 T9SS type A sorting domain-containing protein [Bacteroidales bacterium]